MPFEHGFHLKMRIAGFTSFQRRYLVLHDCPFQTFVKKCHINVMLVFAQITSPFMHNKTADVQEFTVIFVEFLRFFMLFLVIFYNGIIEKKQE